MGKLVSFNFVSLDGFFAAEDGDTMWHRHGEEENQYAAEMLSKESTLIFGRITYEMMASFWPTPFAAEHDPVVAAGMNRAEKIVFSKTLTAASWSNTTLLSGPPEDEILRLKSIPGKELAILGSGSIVSQLTEKGLIDEFQVMIDPLILGAGIPLFSGLSEIVQLELLAVRPFKSGTVLLTYKPA